MKGNGRVREMAGGRMDQLAERLADDLDGRLTDADASLTARYPGPSDDRQPVHTVYVPADRYDADLPGRWSAEALALVDEHETRLRRLLGADADDLLARVRAKLAGEPIEDLRIDFEDGYGVRDDATEDAHVEAAATALAGSWRAGTGPPYAGIRFKSLERPTRRRGLRTLTMFVAAMHAAGAPFDRLVTTLPKVTSVEQVEAMVHLCERLEEELGLASRALRFEIQVETPQSILGPDGTGLVARMIHAAGGRCTGLHYGTYDYSAFCGIAAPYQSMEHPVADHAKLVMQAAAAGTGVRLSDGSTNVLPVGDADAVEAAWALHLRLVRRSLEHGYYQGWDLHPAQLPTRYAATFAFYRESFAAASQRLRAYAERRSGGVVDEPATARALADFLVRAIECGAVSAAEAETQSGMSPAELAALGRPRR